MSLLKGNTITDFSMRDVKVADLYCENALAKEILYLTAFDADKLLAGFRETAGLDMKGAERYAGWESLLIGGHTMGHYLSAVAQAYANPGVEKEDTDKVYSIMTTLIDGLLECQANSKGKPGFVFGGKILDKNNVELQFDNVEKGMTEIFTESWVPWYTLHKILQGAIDVYKLAGYEPAMTLAKGIGDWSYNRVSAWDEETHKTAISIEFGGMNDVLYELYKLTDDDRYAIAAHKFDAENIYEMVATEAPNVLNNHHANTTIPKFIGALNGYIACKDTKVVDVSKYLVYAEKFWKMVTERHTYANGGNSEWEHFGMDFVLDKERTNCNCETCNVYNMLKLSRMLFMVTGEKKYADYYENAYLNTILSSQNPETGMTTYFQAMSTGYFKTFGNPWNKFWCCVGTGMENFTKLNDSLYFKTDNALLFNIYESSILRWEEKNLEIRTIADFTKSEKVIIRVLTTDGAKTKVDLAFRLPSWLAGTAVIEMDTKEFGYEVSDGYAIIPAGIENETTITLKFPMTFTTCPLADNRNSVAFKYGPILLSANLGCEDMITTTTGVDVTIPEKKVEGFDSIVLPEGVNRDEFIGNPSKYFEHAHLEEGFALTVNGLKFGPHFKRYKERYGLYFEVV